MLEKEPLTQNTEPVSGDLYVIGTPIGNLDDLSPRAQAILAKVSLIACEDTRHSGQLLKKLSIKNNLISFHKHNTQSRIPKLLKYLENGQSLGLISDAGLPGISDPGEELISATKNAGYKVICIPGPCAATTALVSSGLPASKFCFEGFLPIKTKARKKALSSISKEKRTTVIYESPHRLIRLLEELYEFCGENRPVQVARELTKKHEQQVGKTIKEVLRHFQENKPRGECTIILGGFTLDENEESPPKTEELLNRMNLLIREGFTSSLAAKELAKETGLSKRYLYSLIHKKENIDTHTDKEQAK